MSDITQLTVDNAARWCGVLSRIEAIKNGKSVDAALSTGSTSEVCALAIIYGRNDLLPRGWPTPGDAWQRLDDRQRGLVRRHAPRRAAAAERAAAREATKGDGSRKPGRPPLGERALTAAERKRRSREAAGAATLEAIDRAIVAEIQQAAGTGARWVPGLIRAVASRFAEADRERITRRIRNT